MLLHGDDGLETLTRQRRELGKFSLLSRVSARGRGSLEILRSGTSKPVPPRCHFYTEFVEKRRNINEPTNFFISPYNFLFITNSSSSSPPFHRLSSLPLNSIRPFVDWLQKEEVEWFLGPLLVLVDLGVKEEGDPFASQTRRCYSYNCGSRSATSKSGLGRGRDASLLNKCFLKIV